MKDFTIDSLYAMLTAIPLSYKTMPLSKFYSLNQGKSISFRHDIDRKPRKALRQALLESSLNIGSTYYFRTTNECLSPEIITQIASLGHEIGYHYENLATVASKLGIKNSVLRKINTMFSQVLHIKMHGRVAVEHTGFDDILKKADSELQKTIDLLFCEGIKDFEFQLSKLRELIPVSTIAMHGCPGVPIDNRLLWLKYDYRDYGIELEPYFDLDYDEVFYITDAGRTWNDPKANQRDKVTTKLTNVFNSSKAISEALIRNELVDRVLISIHPEHWTDSDIEWYWIWTVRKLKNIVKRCYTTFSSLV